MSLREIKKQIQDLVKAKEIDSAVSLCQKSILVMPQEKFLQKKLLELKTQYIQEKLDSELLKGLIEKKDWGTLYMVYEKLKNIFPESKELQKRIINLQKEMDIQKKKDQLSKEEIYYEYLNQLLSEKKLNLAFDSFQKEKIQLSESSKKKRMQAKIERLRDSILDEKMDQYFKTHHIEKGLKMLQL